MPEGVKFRGKSVYQVLTRLKDVSAARTALWHVQQATNERVARLEREAKEYILNLKFPELEGLEAADLFFGIHKCASPTDRCIYNQSADHWHDHCLFCGEPEERK